VTRRAVGRGKGYPQVAQNAGRTGGSAIDARTTRHAGYTISRRVRKRVEEIFGWLKTMANFRKTRFKGLDRTEFASYLVGAADNLLRIAKLLSAAAA
jgi:IS5 family transposase